MKRPDAAVATLKKRIDRLEKLLLPFPESLPARVEALVCDQFRVTREEIYSSRRLQYIADARFALWWILNVKGVRGNVLAEIYGRPKNTISEGIASAQSNMETEYAFRANVSCVLAKLKEVDPV